MKTVLERMKWFHNSFIDSPVEYFSFWIFVEGELAEHQVGTTKEVNRVDINALWDIPERARLYKGKATSIWTAHNHPKYPLRVLSKTPLMSPEDIRCSSTFSWIFGGIPVYNILSDQRKEVTFTWTVPINVMKVISPEYQDPWDDISWKIEADNWRWVWREEVERRGYLSIPWIGKEVRADDSQ